MTCTYAGAGWVKDCFKTEMSPLGVAVANLLGDMYLGIYHLPVNSLRKVEWNNPRYVAIVTYGSIATFDDDLLTRLLVLCHDRMLRCQIEGVGPKYLRLAFSQRTGRTGHIAVRCPTLEDHVTLIREHYKQNTSTSEISDDRQSLLSILDQ